MSFLTSNTAGITKYNGNSEGDLLPTELEPDAFDMSHIRVIQIRKTASIAWGNISNKPLSIGNKSSLKMLLRDEYLPGNDLQDTPAACHPSSIFKPKTSVTHLLRSSKLYFQSVKPGR